MNRHVAHLVSPARCVHAQVCTGTMGMLQLLLPAPLRLPDCMPTPCSAMHAVKHVAALAFKGMSQGSGLCQSNEALPEQLSGQRA